MLNLQVSCMCKDVLLWHDASPLQSQQECVVRLYHFLILVALHGLHEDGVAVNFYHNHDVFVATLRRRQEMTSLVGEHGFAYPVCFSVDVLNLLSMELGCVTRFQWHWLGFGGVHILSCLIQMALCCFSCLGVVFLYISFIQH